MLFSFLAWLFGKAAAPLAKNKGPKIGDVNTLECTLGQRGMGKSTWQCHRVREQVREVGGHAYVLGHSLGARLPKEMPAELGGGTLPIEYHQTMASLHTGVTKRPSKWHILAPPLRLTMTEEEKVKYAQSTCDELIRYSAQLSQQLRDRAYEREHPGDMRKKSTRDYTGIACPCVIILVDEGIAVEMAGKGDDKASLKRKDWFLEWIYSLRHLHTALYYAIQNPSARAWELLAEATAVYVFRVKHQWALNAINAAGGSRKEMKVARRLAPHEYILIGEDETLADDYDENEDPDLDHEPSSDERTDSSGDRTPELESAIPDNSGQESTADA